MMRLVLLYYDKASDALQLGAQIDKLAAIPGREDVGRFKYVQEKDIETEFERVSDLLEEQIDAVIAEKEDA